MTCITRREQHISAFTLIELAIVLAIVGLIAVSVISGNTLVKQAKFRAQIDQFKKFEIAYNTFRGLYEYRPGDFPDAASFWSTATSGNGNNEINDSNGTTCSNDCGGGTSADDGEKLTFFHHLYLAGLVPDAFTGTGVGPRLVYDDKFSLIAAGKFRAEGDGCFATTPCAPHANVPATYLAGRGNSVSAFQPPDLQAIDLKMDDGLPGGGRLIAAWAANCSTASTTLIYLNSYTKGPSSGCIEMFRLSQ